MRLFEIHKPIILPLNNTMRSAEPHQYRPYSAHRGLEEILIEATKHPNIRQCLVSVVFHGRKAILGIKRIVKDPREKCTELSAQVQLPLNFFHELVGTLASFGDGA